MLKAPRNILAAILIALFTLTILTTPAFAAPSDTLEGDVELEVWSPKKVSSIPFSDPALNTANAARQFNLAVEEGVVTRFQRRPVTSTEAVVESDIETLVVPAGTVVELMAGSKGDGDDAKLVFSGPFRLKEATTVFVVRKWGRPVAMIPACSNPWIGVIPEPLRGKPGRDGAPGIAGLAGAAGRDGKDGADGRDGIDGKDGGDAKCSFFGLFDQPCWLYVPEAVVVAVGVGALACHENWGGICEKDSLATPQTPTCNTGNCVVRSATTGFRVSFGLHF